MPTDGMKVKVNFEVMNDKSEWEDLKMEHVTITKPVITLNMLLDLFKSNVFEIHFSEHGPDGYIRGEFATGEVLQKILKDDVLSAQVTDSHIFVYDRDDESVIIAVYIDYDPDKE